ncbi:hypothetical protein [Hymenobacter sp. B81]
MKRILLLALATATLGLGACNRQRCPAYTKSSLRTAEPVASAAPVAAERQ